MLKIFILVHSNIKQEEISNQVKASKAREISRLHFDKKIKPKIMPDYKNIIIRDEQLSAALIS